jgi:lipopolysaccharide transport system ATP-binding protein
MTPAIKIENLSKQYRLGLVGTGTIKDDLNRWWHLIRGKEDPYLKIGDVNDRTSTGSSNYVWALKDINFELPQGDVLGIIGKNGAGKSTLLKILSKVTAPSTGSITYKGRIGSLLEVGTGFNPELTGRENIYLNGAILGMRKREIDRKLDEIIDFSGCERYIDTPVKRYSSGMTVRLGFAVAAFLEPEILVVDEVLSVGDAEFQKKAIGKIKEVSSGEGKTVLFVSHNMDSILRLCNSCILLQKGTIALKGKTEEIVDYYITEISKTSSIKVYDNITNSPGDETVRLRTAKVIDSDYKNVQNIFIDEKVGIEFEFVVLHDNAKIVCSFNLYNNKEVHILSSHDSFNKEQIYNKGVYKSVIWIPGNMLSEGLMMCGLAAMSYNPFIIHFHDVNPIAFNVIDKNSPNTARGEQYTGYIPGVIRPILEWEKIVKVKE